MPCFLPWTMWSHHIFINYQNPRVEGEILGMCLVIWPLMPGGAWGDTCLHLVSVSLYHLWCEHLLILSYRYTPHKLKEWSYWWSVSSTKWEGQWGGSIRLPEADLTAVARWILSEYLSPLSLTCSLTYSTVPAGHCAGLWFWMSEEMWEPQLLTCCLLKIPFCRALIFTMLATACYFRV